LRGFFQNYLASVYIQTMSVLSKPLFSWPETMSDLRSCPFREISVV